MIQSVQVIRGPITINAQRNKNACLLQLIQYLVG